MKPYNPLVLIIISVLLITSYSCLKRDPFKNLNGKWSLVRLFVDGVDSTATWKANAGSSCGTYELITPGSTGHDPNRWDDFGTIKFTDCINVRLNSMKLVVNNNAINQGWIITYPYDDRYLFIIPIQSLTQTSMTWEGDHNNKHYKAEFSKL